jgi:oligoribonuclease NrnB/cAMP/cGMP phosphodiesterase (DHH superfamily)
MDGAGCAILIKKCFNSVHTAYLNYNEVDDYLKENYKSYEKVIITDVSASIGLIEKIKNKSNLLLIDHHKTSENLKKFDFTVHSLDKSATMLTYEYFTNEGYDLKEYKEMVDCINDYDIWLMQRDDSLKMNIFFTMLGIGRFVNRFLENPSVKFTKHEDLFLTIEKENQEQYLLQAYNNANFFKDNEGRQVAVVFAERYNSELGNYLVTEENLDYVIIINAQKNKISLRSKSEVDISKIAVKNGGGGHKNAAGFSTEFDFCLEKFLKSIGVIS